MRRIVGFVLVGLGAALLTLGVGAKYWAYPRIAQVGTVYPTDKDREAQKVPPAGTTISSGKAEVFIAVAGQPVGPQTVDVVSTRVTKGDPKSAGNGDVYWETRVETAVPSVSAAPINVTVEGLCFDPVEAVQANGCGKVGYAQSGTSADTLKVFDGTPTPRREGVYLKFPFNTEQKTYPFWDSAAEKAFPIDFKGTDTIDGLAVYKFEQTIPDTKVDERDLPAEIFGGTQGTNVTADVMYKNKRTVWIEPETGAVIRGQEEQDRRFVYQGQAKPLLVGTIGYTPETVAANVKIQKDNSSGLHLLRVTLPLVGVIGGLVLLVAGAWLVFLTGTGRRRAGNGGPAVVDVRDPADVKVD